MLVMLDHFEDPVREEIDVRVTVSREHAYLAVFSYQAMPDGETLVLFRDISKRVCCGGVEEFEDMWA